MAQINLTSQWQQISNTACIFQVVEGRDVALFFGTSPAIDTKEIHVVVHNEMIFLPLPTSGTIYARILDTTGINNRSSIVVTAI